MPKKLTTEIDVTKGFEELETITEWFESGKADLTHGLEKFERAAEIAGALRKKLEEAENRIQEITHKHPRV